MSSLSLVNVNLFNDKCLKISVDLTLDVRFKFLQLPSLFDGQIAHETLDNVCRKLYRAVLEFL